MRLTVAALMLIVLPACSSSQVKTEQDWDTDFARYRTYAWSKGAPARDPTIESRIHAAVDFELPFKGLEKVETASSPDLYISTYASVEEQVIDQLGYEVGTSGAATSRTGVLTLPTGTLVIDLVDARSGKLVWRGQATKALDHQVSEATLRKVARDIFRQYPRNPQNPQKD
jgi:hypothetical protein